MTSRFFVELPVDEYGNTSLRPGVVEATVEHKDERDLLVPIAPEYFVKGWPNGWYRDSFGGWAEVAGPARMLTIDEYEALIGSLSEETKSEAGNGLATLRTGGVLPKNVIRALMYSLHDLCSKEPITFYELVMIARDPQHRLFGDTGTRLIELGLLQPDGQPHSITREVVLSATEGELLEMKLVNPIIA